MRRETRESWDEFQTELGMAVEDAREFIEEASLLQLSVELMELGVSTTDLAGIRKVLDGYRYDPNREDSAYPFEFLSEY